ncbi:LuxR C-terminal-related transcriptional regulator [Sporosarcina sp. P33]|uniref:LuxR C-terminal-related transcriptional regulator n=1 Tax=Sporosarcina sp. P33 TaxID=1930764 RepID=UPI001E3697CA|nr:LuxR C-terminal-related transcriptional regulator [Sporosarcina sp. P33]
MLLDEYKKTAKLTRAMQSNLNNKITDCEHGIETMKNTGMGASADRGEIYMTADDVRAWESQYKKLKSENKVLKQEKEIINSMISSLTYSIHCIRYNTEPPVSRSIERRAYYEREIPFEHHWIERRKDDESFTTYDPWPTEQSEDKEYEEKIRKELVEEIKKCLTPRQVDVMELVSMDFSASQIGEMLGITRRAVNYTIEAARKKIKDEGWQML